MKTYKFYDTCSLLLKVETLFDEEDVEIVISSITLNELENIKTASNKDADVKYAARRLLHTLSENRDAYKVWIFDEDMLEPIKDRHLSITDDTKILATAIDFEEYHPDNVIFVTNDLALSNIANLFFGDGLIESVDEDFEDDYEGCLEVTMSDELMTEFYSNPKRNIFDLKINQYIIVKNSDNEIVDTLCWQGDGYRHLYYRDFNSRQFGSVKPYKNDIYQAMYADSLMNNTITMAKGPAGSGKTYLAFAYLFSQLERGKIDKIVIFCNTVATKGSAKLG